MRGTLLVLVTLLYLVLPPTEARLPRLPRVRAPRVVRRLPRRWAPWRPRGARPKTKSSSNRPRPKSSVTSPRVPSSNRPGPKSAGSPRVPRVARGNVPVVSQTRGSMAASVVTSAAPPTGRDGSRRRRVAPPANRLPATGGGEATCLFPNPMVEPGELFTLPQCAFPRPGYNTQHLGGGSSAKNDELENLARSIASALGGAVEILPGPPSSPRSGCENCISGGYSGGLMYSAGLCGRTIHTACVGANLKTYDAERGSSLLHEVMHMYMRRLYEVDFSGAINAKTIYDFNAYCDTYFNEPFTDCLIQVLGAVVLNYRCPAGQLDVAQRLLGAFPPAAYPWKPAAAAPVASQPPANPPAQGSRFVPLATPQRLFDSRSTSPIGAGAVITMLLAGQKGLPSVSEGLTGVVLNVAVTQCEGAGFITLFPGGAARPETSNQNFVAGSTFAGAAFSSTGTQGQLSLYSTSRLHYIVDATAAISSSAGDFATPIQPFRLLDSRGGAILSAGERRLVPVTGVPGTGVTGLFLNIAVTQPAGPGYLTFYPATGGQCSTPPETSTINFDAQTIANSALIPIRDNLLCIFAQQTTHVVVDVNGYISPSGSSVLFPVTPQRLVDTRQRSNQHIPSIQGRLGANQVLSIPLNGVPFIPASATALTVSATVVGPQGPGFLTAWPGPCGAVPNVSILNFESGQVRPNTVVVGIGSDRTLCVLSSASTDLVIDVGAYFASK